MVIGDGLTRKNTRPAPSAVYERCDSLKHDIKIQDVRVLTSEDNKDERRVKKAFFIKKKYIDTLKNVLAVSDVVV